jgi:TPR repeat protein
MDKAEFEALEPAARRSRSSQMEEMLLKGLDLGEGLCAYYLGLYAYFGWFGFPVDGEKAKAYLRHGAALGDGECCQFLADILEEESEDPGQRKEAAKLRLKAVRYGSDDREIRIKLARDYREGLLDEFKDEIERYWLPEEEEAEDDDGRWDAYV